MEERLQKVLAQAGVASRREAEEYITAGRVKVNGKVVKELGTKVGPDAFIMVDGHPIHRERKTYLLFYKPRGVVTTMKDPEGRKTIADYVKDIPQRVYPVGRLDYNTEGLLLLTNDGELAQAMTHPSHEVNKVYEVTVPGIVPQEKLDLLRVGVKLEDGMTAPAMVDLTGYDYEKNLTRFNVTIHEGRNRQVRRMCDYIGFPVRYLRRVQMGTLTLDGLRRGDCRELFNEEIDALRIACGLKREAKPKTESKLEVKPKRSLSAKSESRAKRRTDEKPANKEATVKPKRRPAGMSEHKEAARPQRVRRKKTE
ncbi:MAG: rRNA pseudouridine synthase [Acidaminococcaceae bacterium]|nr:rRNA pseudouridine synthase [Acidaminococcaceae bacterium]